VTRVLVVEDEGVVAAHLQATLERLGYEAPEVAASGEEALRLVDELAPDVVLMDVRLRGPLDGIDTAALLGRRADVPVVFLTAHSDDTNLRRARAVRPQGYLLKPFNERELRTTIEVALSNHDADRERRQRERRLDAALQSVDEGVIATDAEGRVVMMNPAAERLTGWRTEDALGRDAWLVLRLDDGPRLGRPRARRHQEGLVLVARNGDERFVEEIVSPVVDERGRAIGAVLVLCDLGGRPAIKSVLPINAASPTGAPPPDAYAASLAAALTTAPPPAAGAAPFLVPTLPSPRWSSVYADVPARPPKPGDPR
jgi:hypothetical protein